MSNAAEPFIRAEESIAELSVRSVLLAIFLTLLLAMSNAYLALKIGILTSASIPAAILSMGILRMFKNATILENNAVQTAASAGGAVAGGIVYTIPALIIIGYWHHFDYWINVLIAASGGILGVLFSIPLRRILVYDKTLRFPEGQAIAEVLKSQAAKAGIKDLVLGGIVGSILELLQVGFKVLANACQYWFVAKRTIFGFGAGFSATLIGAGYLIGYDMAFSIFLGAILAWGIALPIASQVYPGFLQAHPVSEAGSFLWNEQLRYLGIGAMLFAGIWTFLQLIKPLLKNMHKSWRAHMTRDPAQKLPRTEQDISIPVILIGVFLTAAFLFLFFQWLFPVAQAGLSGDYSPTLIFGMVLYVLVIGFLFSVITSYFSGMVGVTASPGSSIIIAGILFAAWLLLGVINFVQTGPISVDQSIAAEAMTIIIGSMVTGIAAIANDNTQDLKVGQLVGATPWKQQLMLLLGVIISSLIIPPIMQLLFNVYGIAGVMPHEGMDISQSLPAPTAALLSAVTDAVFHHALPWTMMLIGAAIIVCILVLQKLFALQRLMKLSVLGVAIGMYLPIASSFPLFIGGVIALFVRGRLETMKLETRAWVAHHQIGTLIACGLVAGAALMDVFLAIPFSIMGSPDALKIVGQDWQGMGIVLSITATFLLAMWIKKRVCD